MPRRLRCDPVSAFGGIIALNRPHRRGDRRARSPEIFTEVVIAPGRRAPRPRRSSRGKKNLRLLTTGGLPDPRAPGLTFRSVAGGFLVQSRDNAVVDDLRR